MLQGPCTNVSIGIHGVDLAVYLAMCLKCPELGFQVWLYPGAILSLGTDLSVPRWLHSQNKKTYSIFIQYY